MANTPTPAATVEVMPNVGGSNKSTPAPKVAIPAGIKKWLWLAAVAIAVVIGISLIVSVWRERNREQQQSASQQVQQQQTVTQGCTSASPCTPVVGTNGSTEIVHIKEGDSVCFEPYFWKNINKLGIKVSYNGGPETGYGSIGDSFRFVPETGLTPPRYWFVPEGSSKC